MPQHERFAGAMALIGWSNVYVAALLRCNEKLVRKWRAGETAVPEPVYLWVLDIAKCHERRPAPNEWRS